MTPEALDEVVRLRHWVRLLVAATLFLYAVVGVIAVLANHTATVNGHALCGLRDDLETRIAVSERTLTEHAGSVEGFSAEALREQVENQRRTVAALAALSC